MTDTTPEAPAAPETPAEQPQEGAEQEPKTFDAAYVAGLRQEAAKYRTEAKAKESELEQAKTAQQQQLDALAKALGLKQDEAPDPAKLAEQVTAEQARARQAAAQLAVYRSAAAKSADVDLLLDSTSFKRVLEDVDPTDLVAVDAAVKAFVDANPRYKATDDTFPGAGQVGIGVAGGGSVPTDPKAADLAQIEADLRAAKRP